MMVKIRFGLFILKPKPNCLILHFPKNLEAMFSRNLIYLGVETKKESKHIYAGCDDFRISVYFYLNFTIILPCL